MKYKLLKNMTSIMGFSIPIISELCIFIDWAIYAVASMALQSFFKMAEISANMFVKTSEGSAAVTVEAILSRVMVLAGVYALFRLGIMLINYMISPENTKKFGQTGTDFVKSIIIAVVLLACSKTIFEQLGKFQWLVINENKLIPKLVYGTETTDGTDPVTYSDKKEADMFTNKVWSLFFQPNENATSGATQAWEHVRSADATIGSMVGRNYNEFDYYPFISGLVGMMLVYYFVIFSIELGSRIIKLVVLQVLSPIPIIMSIDPSQKNKLTNFWKAYFAVYLQIFVRVLTLYIAFVVLDLLQEALRDYGSGLMSSARIMAVEKNFVIDVIMIFAVFQAVKELPKVVEDALGLKLGIQTSGKGSFANLVGGITGGTVGFVGGAIGGYVGAAEGSKATRIGAGLIGAGTGLFHGATEGTRGKDIVQKVSGVTGAVRKSNMLGGAFAATGGVFRYYKGGAENFFGAQRKDQKTIKDYDDAINSYNTKKDELNVDIGDIQSQVSEKESEMQMINRGGEYADAVLNAMDYSFTHSGDGQYIDLKTFMDRNGELQQMKSEYDTLFGPGGQMQDNTKERQDTIDRIAAKEKDLTEEYENRRLQHYEGLLPASGIPTIQDANVSKALATYNAYAREHGLGEINSYRANRGPNDPNRGIPGAGAYPTRFEDLARDRAAVRESLQAQIDAHTRDIKLKQEEIRKTEDARIAKEKEKKDFINSPDVKARDPKVRKTPPAGRAWRGRGPWDSGGHGGPGPNRQP